MNILKMTFTSIILAGLTACATEATPLKDGQAQVNLKSQLGDEMIARRLDDQRAENFKRFFVSPGEHTMEVGVVKRGYQETHRTCLATLTYNDFVQSQNYDLVQTSSLGGGVVVELIDSNGNTVARNDKVACL